MKTILTMFAAVLFNALTGVVFGAAVGVSPVAGAVGANAIAALVGVAFPQGVLRAGVLKEIWTGEMVKALRAGLESTWLDGIPDQSSIVNNDVIHLVEVGIDPDVLVNNTSYPLTVQELEDGDKAVSLDKYQTKPTPITDDELYASSYDKMATVIERHREKVDETKIARALHALAPASDKTETPVLLTSGANAADGKRKMITRDDIIALKAAFDRQKVPVAGRVLVLCPDHVADLLANDQKFADQYYNYTSGKISSLYGFEVYEYADSPLYDATTKAKKAYGSVAGENDFAASVAFYGHNCIRMEGETKAYLSEARTDPENQRNLYDVRHYFMALPLKERAMGAIVSAKVTAPTEMEE